MIELSIDMYSVLSSKSMPLEDLTPGKYLCVHYATSEFSPTVVVVADYVRIYYENEDWVNDTTDLCGWLIQLYPDGYSNPPYSPKNLEHFAGYNKKWCLVKCLL